MRTDCAGGARHRHGFLLSLVARRVFRRSWPCHGVSRSAHSRTRVGLNRASGTSRCQNYLGFTFSCLGETRSCESDAPPAKCEGKQFDSPLLILICCDCGSLPSASSVNCHEFCGLPPMSIKCPEGQRAIIATAENLVLVASGRRFQGAG